MARGKKNTKKNDSPFPLLSQETQDAIAQSSPVEIKERMAKIILLDLSQKEMKALDEKLLKAKEAYDALNEPYQADAAANKQALQCCKQALRDKAQDTSGEGSVKTAAQEIKEKSGPVKDVTAAVKAFRDSIPEGTKLSIKVGDGPSLPVN